MGWRKPRRVGKVKLPTTAAHPGTAAPRPGPALEAVPRGAGGRCAALGRLPRWRRRGAAMRAPSCRLGWQGRGTFPRPKLRPSDPVHSCASALARCHERRHACRCSLDLEHRPRRLSACRPASERADRPPRRRCTSLRQPGAGVPRSVGHDPAEIDELQTRQSERVAAASSRDLARVGAGVLTVSAQSRDNECPEKFCVHDNLAASSAGSGDVGDCHYRCVRAGEALDLWSRGGSCQMNSSAGVGGSQVGALPRLELGADGDVRDRGPAAGRVGPARSRRSLRAGLGARSALR